MKKVKLYKEGFNDFCSVAWMAINTTAPQASALRSGMQDAVMNPLEDITKTKKFLQANEVEVLEKKDAVA